MHGAARRGTARPTLVGWGGLNLPGVLPVVIDGKGPEQRLRLRVEHALVPKVPAAVARRGPQKRLQQLRVRTGCMREKMRVCS